MEYIEVRMVCAATAHIRFSVHTPETDSKKFQPTKSMHGIYNYYYNNRAMPNISLVQQTLEETN